MISEHNALEQDNANINIVVPEVAETSTSETEESEPSESEPSETEISETDEFDTLETYDEVHDFNIEPNKQTKTIYNMTTKELNALSVKAKAKLVGISVKEFKMMTSVINHEAGNKMNDKICVAAVIWNRKYCKQFNNSIKGVINEPGQFYDLSRDKSGSSNDKKAQLAILLAYKKIHTGKIPHNVLFFNSIGFGSRDRKRYTKYKHYDNYFLKDSKCKCKWCKSVSKPKQEVKIDDLTKIIDNIQID